MKKCVLLIFLLTLSLAGLSAQTTPMAKDHSKFLGNIYPNSTPYNFNLYWNQVTPENAGKWGSLQPSNQNSFSWTNLDRAYNYAKDNGYKFKLHTLIWGSQEPAWIDNLSASAQKNAVENLFSQISQRYPDIDFIDVVNEPLHQPPSYKNAIGGNGSTGWDWVIWSFQEARAYFPNAKLLINEYGIISDMNAATTYANIIATLQSQNLIDGIGIQCHQFNLNLVSTTTMENVLNKLAERNLPIYVTELDITGKPSSITTDAAYTQYMQTNSATDEETQYERYMEKFPVLWENENVAGITLWGYIEGATWTPGSGLLNSNHTERKAIVWLKEYMASEASYAPNKFDGTNSIHLVKADNSLVSIYPNPASDYVTVEGKNINRIDLLDISGKRLLTQSGNKTIAIGNLPAGLYIVRIEADGNIIQKKLLKK